MRQCLTPSCRRHRAPSRTICNPCNYERKKKRDPIRYFFGTFRRNAKRRGKAFDITLAEFRSWAKKEGFVPTMRKASGWPEFSSRPSIDRKKNHLGYTIDNIQVLTVRQNRIKSNNPF